MVNIAETNIHHTSSTDIPYQPTSLDIWDQKYRLKKKDNSPVDGSIDDTFQRVARTLANLELT
ncbi:MAG: hypothetical protein V3V89_04770, partial [Gammaproteobacteria bacterium]